LVRINNFFALLLCSVLFFGAVSKKLLVKTNEVKTDRNKSRKHDDYKVTIDKDKITKENFHCQNEALLLKGQINRKVEEINHAVCTSEFQSEGEIEIRRGNELTTLPVFGHEFYISFSLGLSMKKKNLKSKKVYGVFSIVDKSKCPKLKGRNRMKCRLLFVWFYKGVLFVYKGMVRKDGEHHYEDGDEVCKVKTKLVDVNEDYDYDRLIDVKIEQFPKRNGKLLLQFKFDDMVKRQWEIDDPLHHENVVVFASEPWSTPVNGEIHNLVISAFEKKHKDL